MLKQLKSLLLYNKKIDIVMYTIVNLMYLGVLLINPWIQQMLIDNAVDYNIQGTITMIIWTVVLFCVGQILGFFCDWLLGKSERCVWAEIISEDTEKYRHYDMKRKEITDTEVSQQLGQNYERIRDFFLNEPIGLFCNTIQAAGTICILLAVSRINGILVLLFVPFFIIISNKFGNHLSNYSAETVKTMQECKEYTTDVVKLSASERFRKNSMLLPVNKLLEHYQRVQKKQVKQEAVFSNFLSYAFLNFMIALSLIISIVQVLRGSMSIGTLSAIQLYVSKFWDPVENFINFYKKYASEKNIIDSFLEFMNPKVLKYENQDINKINLKGYVSLDAQNKKLHQPIDWAIVPGRINFILGENGCGKTTLALAILGLTDRFRGQIQLNHFGHNSNFCYSPAEVNTSNYYCDVLENNKYSMGQHKLRQLDRDFSEDKDVYIFDEPTNYLDDSHKDEVRKRLEALRKQRKIVLVITHDKELIRQTDECLILEKIH